MKARAGFTLLEVLVATVIMGIAVTGLIVGLSQSVKNASRLAEYERLSQQGVVFRGEPTQRGPVTTAVFEDTCGNLIQLFQAG